MPKSMFVNVTAEEENRVAIVENGVLDVFEIETLSKEHLKGNIFKVIVEGINPALEAAFVNYGGERAGFLPLDEVNFKIYPSRDGGPGGETPRQIGARADRVIERIRAVRGDVLLFTSGHFIRVLACRWLGVEPSSHSRFFMLSTASLSAFGYEHDASRPVIRLWNETRHVERDGNE